MRRSNIVAVSFALALVGCGNPHNTQVPTKIEDLATIQASVDKLTPDEKQLFAGYVVRHTIGASIGALFGGKAPATPIPEGTTIGSAIEEQRQFMATRATEEAKEKALREKLAADREAALSKLRDAVTVTLISKELRSSLSTGHLGDSVDIVVGYRNNTNREVSGVKGTLVAKDQFDDAVTSISISNDQTIPPGGTSTWHGSRSLINLGVVGMNDRKFAELPSDKLKITWEPDTIVFAGGEKMVAPK